MDYVPRDRIWSVKMMALVSLCLSMLDTEEERAAFESFYRRYVRLVWKTAQETAGTKEAAEDVSQEVFLYIAAHFERVRDMDHRAVFRYLELCTRARALNLVRDEKREWTDGSADGAEEAVDMLDAEKVVMDRETIARMRRVIASLPERYRMALELRMMDLPPAEIARALGLPLKTVYKQIERGCKMVRERMMCDDDQ